MARLTNVFPVSNPTFHEKDGARHEFRPMAEYLYNALPFFFPNGQAGGTNSYGHLTTANTVKDVIGHEGFPLAIALSKMGYNAFSIQYRTGGAQVACEDLAQAIDFIIRHAEELQISTDDYSLWGGSAGARMAAYLGSYSTQGFTNATHERPAAVIMGYTSHTDYTREDPPTYVVIGDNDAIASASVMRQRVENLNALGIDAEFHQFHNLRHGFGLGTGTNAEGWEKDAVKFWEKYISRKNGTSYRK